MKRLNPYERALVYRLHAHLAYFAGDHAAARENFEKAFILAELRVHDWNMTRTADRLGIERSHLYRKLKAYGIAPPK